MATQMQLARQGIITEAMLQVAAQEQLAPEVIRAGVAAGTIAVCCNINHKNLVPRGVGQGLAVNKKSVEDKFAVNLNGELASRVMYDFSKSKLARYSLLATSSGFST